jgi:glycosyltransferase involved in cell wall biosynthesis
MLDQNTAAPVVVNDAAPAKQWRILILNWRDITHPQAGGAEKVTHEIARRWVEWGHQVTLFCASYPGAISRDTIDGVRVLRHGRQHTVHWQAYRHYQRYLRGRYDVILDEVNTIPFFAPLYAREPVIMFIHQLAREVWRYEAPFPLSLVGYALEPLYLQAYRHTSMMTVSRSTQDDLRKLGLRGPSHVIPEAVDTQVLAELPPLASKEPALTLAFVGRVVPSKRVDHIVEALALLHRRGTVSRLWLVGSWDQAYRRVLDQRIAALGLGDYVTFWGYVDRATKEQLLARAHLLVMTSVREGWGLVVTEANSLGTPAVVYDVAGLRDSTRDGATGLVCAKNTPVVLARTVAALWRDMPLYERLRSGAWAMAKEFNWERTAREAWNMVEATLSAVDTDPTVT